MALKEPYDDRLFACVDLSTTDKNVHKISSLKVPIPTRALEFRLQCAEGEPKIPSRAAAFLCACQRNGAFGGNRFLFVELVFQMKKLGNLVTAIE